MKTKLTRKRLESLMTKKSIMREILGNYRDAFSLGIVKYSDEEGGPALLLLVEEGKNQQFPRTIKRFNEKINIIVKTGFKPPQLLRENKGTKPINLNKLIEGYYGSGLFLAVSRDHEMVVGTGKTIRKAAEDARSKGFSDAVIMKAPSKEIMGSRMHF